MGVQCNDRSYLDTCANAYLGRGIEAGHGLGEDLLLTRGEGAEAATSTSLGSGGGGTVLGVVRFACHFERMQRGGQNSVKYKALELCEILLSLVCVRDVDGEGRRLQVWRGKVA